MKRLPKLTFWRILLPALTLFVIVFLCMAVLLAGRGPWMSAPADMLPSNLHFECQHEVSDTVQLRTAYRIYAGKHPSDYHQIDPNNFQDEFMVPDLWAYGYLRIPSMDYQISHDSGITWENFWRFPFEWSVRYPYCNFGQQNQAHFWVWYERGIAVTHDGGYEWHTSPLGEGNFAAVEFSDMDTGRIEQSYGPDLLTTDGGRTWHEAGPT